MSWQAYVDSSLVGSGHVDKGIILSIAGDSTWAASPGFALQAGEGANIAAMLGGAVDKAYADGFHIQGLRYVLTKTDERSIYGRGTGEHLKEGVVIVATKQCILIAHYGAEHIAGNSNQTVEALADYLIKLGY